MSSSIFLVINAILCAGLQTIALYSRPPSSSTVLNDLLATRGSNLVFESTVQLYSIMLLFALDECSHVTIRKPLVLLFCACTIFVGPCAPLCILYAYLLRCPPREEADPSFVFFALILVAIIYGVFLGVMPSVCSDGSCPDPFILHSVRWVPVLMIPVPILFFQFPKGSGILLPKIVSSLLLLIYLIIGAHAFVTHTREFEDASEANVLIQQIMNESLATGASRFLFINFVHLTLASAVLIGESRTLRGAVGVMSLGVTMVGPAASFAFFAGLERFLILRKLHEVPKKREEVVEHNASIQDSKAPGRLFDDQ